MLDSGGKGCVTTPVGLYGLGGIGKTELALAYAQQQRGSRYDAGYFLVADSAFSLDYGLAKIGNPELSDDAPDEEVALLKQRALEALRGSEGALLILDNVDEIVSNEALQSVLASLPTVAVVLTCRHKDMGDSVRQLPIGKMEGNVGALYLLRLGLGDEDGGRWDWLDFTEKDRALAIETDRELDGLPLALHHAGAAVRGEQLSLAELLADYRANRQRILSNRGKRASATHPDSALLTAVRAYEKLKNRSPSAAELVLCCAFLAPDAISEDLFTAGMVQAESPLKYSAELFAVARATALKSALIERFPAERRLAMHRVTQAILQELPRLNPRARLEKVTNSAVLGLLHAGRFREAIVHAEFGLAERTRLLGPHHRETLTSLGNLASALAMAGRSREALKLKEEDLALRKKLLGERDPDTLLSMSNLATNYLDLGMYEIAVELETQAITLREEVLGEKHPSTLASLGNLASTYLAMGRTEEALELNKKVHTLRTSVLGENHRETLTCLANIASTYSRIGRHSEALSMELEVLARRKESLGESHPETLASMSNLASTYTFLGRYEEAFEIKTKVMAQLSDSLGQDHPQTLTCISDLAGICLFLGKSSEALGHARRAVELRRKALGEKHPETLVSMAILAHTLWNTGNKREALALEKKTLAMRKGALGHDHADTIMSMKTLASKLHETGLHDQAVALEERALTLSRKTLGQHHPDTLRSMANLGWAYWHLKRRDEAISLVNDAFTGLLKILGPSHADTIAAKENLDHFRGH